MDIKGNTCRRIKSWVYAQIAAHKAIASAHHTDHKVAQAESAEFKEVNIPINKAYKENNAQLIMGKGDNAFIGRSGNITLTGDQNICLGLGVGTALTSASYNMLIGTYTGHRLTTGGGNLLFSYGSGYNLTTGEHNVMIGYMAGYYATTGLKNVFLGYYAGFFETGNNKLMVDFTSRANEADGRIKALIYGIFSSTTANQLLRINAKKVELPQLGNYANDAAAAAGGIAVGGLYRNGNNVQVRIA